MMKMNSSNIKSVKELMHYKRDVSSQTFYVSNICEMSLNDLFESLEQKMLNIPMLELKGWLAFKPSKSFILIDDNYPCELLAGVIDNVFYIFFKI